VPGIENHLTKSEELNLTFRKENPELPSNENHDESLEELMTNSDNENMGDEENTDFAEY
jgi:hypothetical protein